MVRQNHTLLTAIDRAGFRLHSRFHSMAEVEADERRSGNQRAR